MTGFDPQTSLIPDLAQRIAAVGDDHIAESYESHQQNELSLLFHLIYGLTSQGLDLIEQGHFVVHGEHHQDQPHDFVPDLDHEQQSGPDR